MTDLPKPKMWQFRAALLRVLSFTSWLLHYKNAVVKLYLILSHQGRDSTVNQLYFHLREERDDLQSGSLQKQPCWVFLGEPSGMCNAPAASAVPSANELFPSLPSAGVTSECIVLGQEHASSRNSHLGWPHPQVRLSVSLWGRQKASLNYSLRKLPPLRA